MTEQPLPETRAEATTEAQSPIYRASVGGPGTHMNSVPQVQSSPT